MRVLHVASEVAPWAQTGGLADVVGALPAALAAADPSVQPSVVVPLYLGVEARLAAAGVTLDEGFAWDVELPAGRWSVRVRRAGMAGVRTWFVDCPALYAREGFYTAVAAGGPAVLDWPDNHLRFAVLAKIAVDAGHLLCDGEVDVLHAHDWQAGLAPVYLRLDPTKARTAAVTTIHNLAYRGVADKLATPALGLPWSVFTIRGMEYFDHLSLLKGGLAYADAVTTVSPTYAREILEPHFGEGLEGFLRWDVGRIVGIVNGIDTVAWDPATDAALPAQFSRSDLGGKAACRAALAEETGLVIDHGTPLAAVVSRLTDQKGLDLVADLVPDLYRLGIKLVVLGSGDAKLEERFRWLANVFKNHVAVTIGFDVARSRRIYGGADLFLMPSRFEPCGLGQLYAMRYGAIPVVHRVGGLADTVVDSGDTSLGRGDGTGFAFGEPTVSSLRAALARAAALFRDPRDEGDRWKALRLAAMARDSSWGPSAREYLQLYRAVLRARR